MKKHSILFLVLLASAAVSAQTLTSRTSKAVVDFKSQSNIRSSFPAITWTLPKNQTVFQREPRFVMKMRIDSKDPLKSIIIRVKDKDGNRLYGSKKITVAEEQQNSYLLEQPMVLLSSINEVEVVAENVQGIVGVGEREVHVGETILADAKKLKRSDYALIIYTNEYDHWQRLTNPGFDATTIADLLKNTYGFQVDMLENPSQELIWTKMKEFAERKYEPLDQVFIFVAGHGHFDEAFKEGYIVTKESIPNEPGNASYISHNRLRNNINSIPCEHIFLTMDVCFGGTFDEGVANTRGPAWTDTTMTQSEFIVRKLAYHTRKYLTSGGKEYVSDGLPGHHSPFAAKLIAALETQGGNDGILTLAELQVFTEKSTPAPLFGKFGDDAPGSEFVFIVK